MERTNIHATALVVGGLGLLIVGNSGAGKSLLASAIIERSRQTGRFAALVADDRVWLSVTHGRLVAEAPAEIEGLIELRGYGPAGTDFERLAVIDRQVRLVAPADAPRVHSDKAENVMGIRLPTLLLGERATLASCAAVIAWLAAPDFGHTPPV